MWVAPYGITMLFNLEQLLKASSPMYFRLFEKIILFSDKQFEKDFLFICVILLENETLFKL